MPNEEFFFGGVALWLKCIIIDTLHLNSPNKQRAGQRFHFKSNTSIGSSRLQLANFLAEADEDPQRRTWTKAAFDILVEARPVTAADPQFRCGIGKGRRPMRWEVAMIQRDYNKGNFYNF